MHVSKFRNLLKDLVVSVNIVFWVILRCWQHIRDNEAVLKTDGLFLSTDDKRRERGRQREMREKENGKRLSICLTDFTELFKYQITFQNCWWHRTWPLSKLNAAKAWSSVCVETAICILQCIHSFTHTINASHS